MTGVDHHLLSRLPIEDIDGAVTADERRSTPAECAIIAPDSTRMLSPGARKRRATVEPGLCLTWICHHPQP